VTQKQNWMTWVAAHTPGGVWVAFPVLAVLYVVGSGVGSLASDAYWTLRWHVKYRGENGRARWDREVEQWMNQ
jgi:hypothetical protein